MFTRIFRPTHAKSLLLRGTVPQPSRLTGHARSFSTEQKTALVVGSSGATGSAIAYTLSQSLGSRVIGADIVQLPQELLGDWELDGFIELPRGASLPDLTLHLTKGMNYYLEEGAQRLDAIIVASGGWAGDPKAPTDGASSEELEAGAVEYSETISKMLSVNLDPALASGYIAQHYMKEDGLMVVILAAAILAPTPGMLGYGVSKTAAAHLMQTLGACTGKSLDSKPTRKEGQKARVGLRAMESMTVFGLCPTVIDTPMNRKAMPNANFSEWVKPLDIADQIVNWVEKPALRPHSGSMVKVYPKKDAKGSIFDIVR